MTVVSKFRVGYIAQGILFWAFLLFMANVLALVIYSVMIGDYAVLDMRFEHLQFTPALLVLLATVSVTCYVLYFVFLWRMLKMTVTEDEIVVKNLFTGTTKRIIYGEIAKISGHIQMNTSGGYMPQTAGGGTSTRKRTIKLIDGLSIAYDNNTYANFNALDGFIQENFYKNKM